jgi:hypothetical protein
MRRTNIVLSFLLLVLMTSSCIRSFEPDIRAIDENKYVVSGLVSEGDEIQTVNVSRSSPINDPSYLPVTGCTVVIWDDLGHPFPLQDAGDGDYTGTVDPSSLVAGRSFMVEIATPAGERIVSGFDTLFTSPEIDSVYYLREDIEGNTPGQFTLGIQFYLDFNGDETNSPYFRWDLYETWEYHSDYPLEWYYDGTVHHVFPPDYSLSVCWTTRRVPTIYTLSTRNLQENKYNLFPLNYVTNRTPRLQYGYSLLVRQHSLSERAYLYWEQQRINSDQEGGLYEKQPVAVKGNLSIPGDPEKEVLGFFGAGTVKTKRIFVRQVPDLPLDVATYCDRRLLRNGLREITPSMYPGYLLGDQFGYFLILLEKECVDCLILGGINIKPDFWPW